MNGNITIKSTEHGGIRLRFCTWSLREFCRLEGIEFMQLEQGLSAFKDSTLINLVTAASKYFFVKEGKEYPYSELDICDWIDENGGFVDFTTTITTALSESMNAGIEEKKSNPEIQV